jgi:translation initiation factor 2 beta subunit (eIF-2beta)/eIF-5
LWQTDSDYYPKTTHRASIIDVLTQLAHKVEGLVNDSLTNASAILQFFNNGVLNMRIPTLVVIVSISGLLSTAAVASHKKSEVLGLIDDARIETQAIEMLVEDSAPRQIERRLMRRLDKLEDILNSLEGELIDRERKSRRGPRIGKGGQETTQDNFQGMIFVEDLVEMPVELPSRQVSPDDYYADENQGVSPGELLKIISILDSEAFSDGRLELLQSAIIQRRFLVSQVQKIMAVFPFGDDKVKAATMLFPRVNDTENWFTIYAELDFDSDRKALRSNTGI